MRESSVDLLCDALRRKHGGDPQAFRVFADLPREDVGPAIELVAAVLEHLRTVRSVHDAQAELGAAFAAAGRAVDRSWVPPEGWSGR